MLLILNCKYYQPGNATCGDVMNDASFTDKYCMSDGRRCRKYTIAGPYLQMAVHPLGWMACGVWSRVMVIGLLGWRDPRVYKGEHVVVRGDWVCLSWGGQRLPCQGVCVKVSCSLTRCAQLIGGEDPFSSHLYRNLPQGGECSGCVCSSWPQGITVASASHCGGVGYTRLGHGQGNLTILPWQSP